MQLLVHILSRTYILARLDCTRLHHTGTSTSTQQATQDIEGVYEVVSSPTEYEDRQTLKLKYLF
jgi:hypothetical protein